MSLDVNIYCSHQSKEPVFTISCLEFAAKSPAIRSILHTINVCDGCQTPVSIIFAEEDRHTVVAAMSQMTHFKKSSSLSIIQGNLNKYLIEIILK